MNYGSTPFVVNPFRAVNPTEVNTGRGANVKAYSFADIHARVIFPYPMAGGSSAVELPGLTLVNLSTHRDTYPVTSCGRAGIKGYTTGHRVCAGSLGFNLYTQEAFAPVMALYAQYLGEPAKVIYMTPDELPPLDLNLVFLSEQGDASQMVLRGLKLVDKNTSLNIHDIQLMDSYAFMAMNYSNILPLASAENGEYFVRQSIQGALAGSIQDFENNPRIVEDKIGFGDASDSLHIGATTAKAIIGNNVGPNGEPLVQTSAPQNLPSFLGSKGAPSF